MKDGTHILTSGAGGVVTIKFEPRGALLRGTLLGSEKTMWLNDEALATLKELLQ